MSKKINELRHINNMGCRSCTPDVNHFSYKFLRELSRLDDATNLEPTLITVPVGEKDEFTSEFNFTSAVEVVTSEIARMLIDKNSKYGNAALDPVRIFSDASTIEQINVRIDDKLSRIANRSDDEDEDPEFDAVGYIILKIISKRYFNEKDSV